MSMRNSNETIWNRTRDLSVCSAVPQTSQPPRASSFRVHYKYLSTYVHTFMFGVVSRLSSSWSRQYAHGRGVGSRWDVLCKSYTGYGGCVRQQIIRREDKNRRNCVFRNVVPKYTGLFEMIVWILTTCHTQYTWDSSICVFLFNRTTLQDFVTYLTGALYVHRLWFYRVIRNDCRGFNNLS